MSEPKTAAKPGIKHKVGREVVNPIAPHPVRILLESPLTGNDKFALMVHKAAKSSAPGVKLGSPHTPYTVEKGHVVIEFDLVRDDADYEFVHSRASTGGGEPERENGDPFVPLTGDRLTHPDWKTPGEPAANPSDHPPYKIQPPRRKPPDIHEDKLLLKEDVTDFGHVRVEDPKIEG